MLTTILQAKTFILAAMLYINPLHKHTNENPTERLNRYDSIAQDIVDVALDPNEEPLFDGEDGRIKTALFITSTANNESDFDKNVDNGKKLGDHGRSICLLQIQYRIHHYTKFYLISDRKNCLRAGLQLIRVHRCGSDIPYMMRGYMSGSCKKRKDPANEKIIANAAYSEVSGYLQVMNYLKKSQVNEYSESLAMSY